MNSGVWTLVPVSRPLLDAVARRVAALPKRVYIRAGDAMTRSPLLGWGSDG